LTTFKRLHESWTAKGVQLLMVNAGQRDARFRTLVRQLPFAVLHGSDDALGVYNILFRQLFDRHRDLPLPTSFLIDAKGEIVKVYQGPLNSEHVEQDIQQIPRNETERIAKALPFSGVSEGFEFRRNYLSLGSVFYQWGYFDQAKTSFRSALAEDPLSAEALYGLGSVYLQQEKAGEAREAFERVVKLQPNYPDTLPNAWNNLGLLATREGRMSEAVQLFEKALNLSPDHLIALVNLGNAFRKQKEWENARSVLERAVAVSPDDPEANYSLGMAFAQLNDSQASYEHLQKALKVRPDYPEALNNLGVLYLRTGRRDQAVASFEACIRVAPSFDQSYLNLARVYALEEDLGKARAVLEQLLTHHPGHLQAQKMLEQMPP
jgi:tetratricopeptide (TPR) repeat protein